LNLLFEVLILSFGDGLNIIEFHIIPKKYTLGHEVWKRMWAWARKKHVSKTAKEIKVNILSQEKVTNGLGVNL
jgi:hypothetical protein